MRVGSILRKTMTRKGRAKLRDAFIQRTTLPFARTFNGWLPYGPGLIAIEPTNRCNLRCKICARSYWDSSIAIGDMSMETFNKIVPYFSKRVSVSPQMFGEPLLAPHFFEMLHIIKKCSRVVVINTNGILLTPKNCDELVKEGIDVLAISMDGIDTLKSIRGVEIDKMIRNIENLNQAKKGMGSNKPRLAIAFVAMKSNVHELPNMIEFAHHHNISGIHARHLLVYSKELANESLFNHKELANRYFKIAQNKAQELNIGLLLPSLNEEPRPCVQGRGCMEPFESLWIAWNGDVHPCCVPPAREKGAIILGNINTDSLPKIWNNVQMRKLRRELLGYLPLNEYCKKCWKHSNKPENFIRVLD